MKIVCFLQNQWFKNPDSARRALASHPENRSYLVRAWLFMGCITGRRLRASFGEEFCDSSDVIWDNVSPQIGGYASAVFPPDFAHIRAILAKHEPQIVVAFGKVAAAPMIELSQDAHWRLVTCPHPAARHARVQADLSIAARRIRDLQSQLA